MHVLGGITLASLWQPNTVQYPIWEVLFLKQSDKELTAITTIPSVHNRTNWNFTLGAADTSWNQFWRLSERILILNCFFKAKHPLTVLKPWIDVFSWAADNWIGFAGWAEIIATLSYWSPLTSTNSPFFLFFFQQTLECFFGCFSLVSSYVIVCICFFVHMFHVQIIHIAIVLYF